MSSLERRATQGAVPVVIAENVAPVAAARRIIDVCRAIPVMPGNGGAENAVPLEIKPDNLPRALALDDAMPSLDVIEAAEDRLAEACDRQLDRPVAYTIIALMLGALGRKPNDNAELYVWGLSEATGDDALSDDAPLSMSPCTLALAALKIIREAKFPPTPAELRAACEQVAGKLADMRREIEHYAAVRDTVDVILIMHGPEERRPPVDGDDDIWDR
ncbi:MAG: hypothetical protein ACLPKT_23955 [Methylocella sp.]